jgi:hypothetical protein
VVKRSPPLMEHLPVLETSALANTLHVGALRAPDPLLDCASHLEVHDLAECSLRVCRIAEGVEALLQRNNGSRPFIDRFPHHAVRPVFR